ncbi:dihydropteroate synthase [Secundilactobacillus paracollinoides]|uniref:dihydropteroate synthase n=1 Tax=Secundilactobacillus paracollinoides TaxID=240427 RepID=UPI0021E96129|nr:dihydropteroate synthase [Secundilactobacillus paracollinoides]
MEIERTIPYIKQIKQLYPDMAVGIDTYKLPVMKAAIDAGVDVINDVNSFTDDPEKLPYLAQQRVGLLTMLNGAGTTLQTCQKKCIPFLKTTLKPLRMLEWPLTASLWIKVSVTPNCLTASRISS